MKVGRFAVVLLLALAARAQDEVEESDREVVAAFQKAVALQKKGKWVSAKKAFRRFMKRYPESPWIRDADIRGGDNAYLRTESLWRGGPSERRIDVVLMGDGFTVDASGQAKQTKWSKLCVDVLWNGKAYSEYRRYFNIWFVRLASLEEGVDPQLSPEERRKIEEKNRLRRGSRRKKTDYSTALDCKAAGPQGQVMSDRRLVHFWLDYANEDVPGCGGDQQVIVFAQFGKLGMGGGGIANVGRPDKSITTHEFGHSFCRLLDEYTGNPNPPPSQGYAARFISAANVSLSPDPAKVPWAHMLERKIKGVGIFEGGATYDKGVWRPARTCAMNAAGESRYCPVCREQCIKVIYEYVNPIDLIDPVSHTEITLTEGEKKVLTVTPLEPWKRKLDVTWFVAPWQVTKREVGDEQDPASEGAADDEDPPEDEEEDLFGELPPSVAPSSLDFAFAGKRAWEDRSQYDEPPRGTPTKWAKWVKPKKTGKIKPSPQQVFPLSRLGPGTWQITVQVKDNTKWVIKDDRHLLEERATWFVTVKAAAE